MVGLSLLSLLLSILQFIFSLYQTILFRDLRTGEQVHRWLDERSIKCMHCDPATNMLVCGTCTHLFVFPAKQIVSNSH